MKSAKLFIKKLKALRLRDDLSQEQLAELLKVHPNTVGYLETLRPSVKFETLDNLANVFNVLPGVFFSPNDLSAKRNNIEKKELLIKKIEELSPNAVDILFRIAFSLDEKELSN